MSRFEELRRGYGGVDAARASFSTDQPHLAIAELTSWKETATAIAAGLGGADLAWLDEDTAVEGP